MRVLVADDSVIFRKIMTESILCIPDTEIVGVAPTGTAALRKAIELRPDLLTLDIEMPGMNGIEVLDGLQAAQVRLNVILVSSVTSRGSALTLQGLSKGAFDFITKPAVGSYEDNFRAIKADLLPRVRELKHRLEVRAILKGGEQAPIVLRTSAAPLSTLPPRAESNLAFRSVPLKKPEMVLIGVSTGGPNALERVVSQLPEDLGVPVLIVQHMPPVFTRLLAENLSRVSRLKVVEAQDGEAVSPNVVYIAPGGLHMRLTPGGHGRKLIKITDDPPENNCRPAVDYLFRSVAHNFPGEAMAVILTGMGSDGVVGLRLLKRSGCRVIAQNEASCVVFGMPKAAIEGGVVDSVVPIGDVAASITATVHGVLT